MSSIFQHLSKGHNFFLLAGPCVIEGEDMAYETGRRIAAICRSLDIPFAFKGSYRKANRSRLDSFTGIGDLEALRILSGVGRELGVPVVTDIHTAQEAAMAADFVDILQIPAFLCRQTDLLLADVAATERGTTFGYGDLVVDFRGVPEMQAACQCPVIVDCTHSLQQPNTSGGVTGGRPELIETIARAAVATGADGLFMETHPEPSVAKSDGANMLRLDLLEPLLTRLVAIRRAINAFEK